MTTITSRAAVRLVAGVAFLLATLASVLGSTTASGRFYLGFLAPTLAILAPVLIAILWAVFDSRARLRVFLLGAAGMPLLLAAWDRSYAIANGTLKDPNVLAPILFALAGAMLVVAGGWSAAHAHPRSFGLLAIGAISGSILVVTIFFVFLSFAFAGG